MNTCHNINCMNMILLNRKFCCYECYWVNLRKTPLIENRVCQKEGCKSILTKKQKKFCSNFCSYEDKKGKSSWNKGLTKFDDVRIKSNRLGQYQSEETKQKIRLANKGRISKNKGKKCKEETKQKIREARAKQVFSEESKDKKSKKMKEHWANPEFKQRRIENNPILQKDKKLTDEHRDKIGQGNKGKVHSEEQNELNSKNKKLQWQDPEYIKKQMKSRNVMPNKTEMYLQSIITSVTNNFAFVGDGKEIIGGKCPDFIDKVNNKIIELYGDYWHKGQDPNDRINYFKNFGYDTLVIWESELKNVDNLKNKLEVFANG